MLTINTMGFITDSSSSSRRMALPTAIKLICKSKKNNTFKKLNNDDQTKSKLNHYLEKQSSSSDEEQSSISSSCSDTLATSLTSDLSSSERDSVLTIDCSTSSSEGILIDSSNCNNHIKKKKAVHFLDGGTTQCQQQNNISLVTEVHTRPFFTYQQKRELFYTQYELYRFGRLKRTIDLIEKNRKFYGINCDI